MRNYDFHQLLSPKEFELRIRENQKVKTNCSTKDGGIDLYFLEEDTIGQVKNYKNNANNVIKSLKKEVERVKKLKIKRYIIVTSAVISKEKREILLSMFEGYLEKEDIIDKDDLNELLTDPKYHKLEIEYLKLLVPNSFILSHYLNRIENNKIYTETEIELGKMKQDKKIFSTNEVVFDALDKLLEEKTIIISGEPGVGKSILGRMLCAYFINSNPDIEFISINSLDELFQIYKKEKSQVYFFDDFWGDTKYNFRITDKEKERLIDFIEHIKDFDNKWLIITTREYILKDGIQLNHKLKDKYQLHKFFIDMKEISKTSKFNILFNHINKTNLSWPHLNVLLKRWKNIVENDNYNPRYIETFLINYEKYSDLEEDEFFNHIMEYLDNPYEFWKDIFHKQSMNIRLLLIIIALNNKELNIKELNKKYINIINLQKLENDFLIEFRDYIKRMDNEFTITKLVESKDELIIEFKNPSYKDFIYEYLKDNLVSYLSYIFNEHLELDEMINLWNIANKNYELYKDLKEIKMLDKMIYDRLLHQDIESNYYSLLELAEVTEFGYSTTIESYLISVVKDSLENVYDIMFLDGNHYQLIFHLLSELVNKYDFSSYIYDLLNIVVFESEDLFQIEKITILKKVYPHIYEKFYKENRYEIRNMLISCIEYDIYYYEGIKDLDSLDFLKYDDIPQLYKELNIKVPNKLVKEIDAVMERVEKEEIKEDNAYFFNSNSLYYDKQKKKEEDISLVDIKIKELIGENECIFNIDTILKSWKIPSKIKKKITKIEQDDLLYHLVYNKNSLYLLCQYFSETDNDYSNDSIDFLNKLENYFINSNDFHEEDIYQLYTLSFSLIMNKKLIFKKDELKDLPIFYCDFDKMINSSFFIKRGKWYHFVHPIIQMHLMLKGITKIEVNINLETIISILTDSNLNWWELDFSDYDRIIPYQLMNKMFLDSWNQFVRVPIYREFIECINTSSNIEIAISIIKQFSFTFKYYYSGRISMVYRHDLLYNLLKLDFDIDMIDFFSVDFTENDELNNFLLEFAKNNIEFQVNKYLRKLRFINLLKESGIMDILNKLYHDIIDRISE